MKYNSILAWNRDIYKSLNLSLLEKIHDVNFWTMLVEKKIVYENDYFMETPNK